MVSGLLIAVAAALLLIGFAEVRRAAHGLADARLTRADSALADLFQNSNLSTRLKTLASDSALVHLLRGGGRGAEPGMAAMRRMVSDTSSSASLELRDSDGKLVLRTGRFEAGADAGPPDVPPTDSVSIGPLMAHDTTLYFHATAAIRRDEVLIGVLHQVARIGLNARTRRTLTGLGGGDVELLLGNAAGDPWTDFGSIIPAPPASVRTGGKPVNYERGELKRASARHIPGTPWMVVAELPVRVIIAPARAYQMRMLPIAVLVVLIGAVTAWLGSRRISAPLREVTLAAEAIAGGDKSRRAKADGPDEVRRLARSFNTMADQVSDSQQNLEKQVVDRTRDLEATNAELESFSYSVSHDLRAPLRAIHGFARILLDDHKEQLDAEAQRLLGVIDQNTRRMGQLIDDLLSFSRLGRTELATARVDMGDLARNVADEVRRSEGERELEIIVGALPPARGDRALLRQVVSNLVSNAAKFTRGRAGARIEVGYQPDGAEAKYYVKDNGAGFDDRYADKLFGVFQRLHTVEEFEGTGVGLAIVKRIVQRHGGRVWAESKLDQGATFYFTLPLSEG